MSPGIVAPTVRGALGRGVALAACAAGAALLACGCGEAQRNAHEARRDYPVEVLRARFPRRQAIARDSAFELVVRNPGPAAIPNLTATIDSFYYTSDYPRLAARQRPIWIVNDGPGPRANPPVESEEVDRSGAGATAFVDTWSLGALAAGAERAFVWRVTPVKAGQHAVDYSLAAGVDGRATASLPGGGKPVGTLVAQVAPAPPRTHVNPETGAIAAGPNPVSAAPVGAVP